MGIDAEISSDYAARRNRERRGMRGGQDAPGIGHPGYEVRRTAKPPRPVCNYCGHKMCKYKSCGCTACHLTEALAEVA